MEIACFICKFNVRVDWFILDFTASDLYSPNICSNVDDLFKVHVLLNRVCRIEFRMYMDVCMYVYGMVYYSILIGQAIVDTFTMSIALQVLVCMSASLHACSRFQKYFFVPYKIITLHFRWKASWGEFICYGFIYFIFFICVFDKIYVQY